jgi:hypothetical protein
LPVLSEDEDRSLSGVEGPCFDPDSPHQSPRPRRPRRHRSATQRRHQSLAGLPRWYREAFLDYDPENPGEFIKRVLNMLADQLYE